MAETKKENPIGPGPGPIPDEKIDKPEWFETDEEPEVETNPDPYNIEQDRMLDKLRDTDGRI